jgi:CubicO group peptidase (beta-lactamase class C family)
MKRTLLVALIATAFASTAIADVPTVNPALHTGGLARNFNNVQFQPSTNPLPLPNKSLSWTDKNIVSRAEQLIDNNKTTALLLVEKGEIVFEKYKDPATQSSPLFSQSMSKSLTAYAFGAVMCSGKVRSLDDRADTYAETLKGTIFGEATIRNLLRMSSGTTEPTLAGSHDPREWFKLRDGMSTTVDILHGDVNTRDVQQGSRFRYSSTDTWSIAEVARGAGESIEQSFKNNVWAKARTESTGYWLHDKSGRLLTQSGFSATARDWARLAIYTIKTLQGENGACMQDYMKQATSSQIKNSSGRIGKAFNSYGYQTWIADFRGKKSYWWVGYGGQRVAIDPESEKIMVLTSWKEDYMREAYNFFVQWQ